MKKNLSLAGLGLAAMGLFMGSCVSKRKYMEAQAGASQRYATDSTEWATRTNTMQQNLTSLEQKSAGYQKQMDSFKTSSTKYQKRWDNIQSAYTQQNTSTDQLHQQIHTAVDQYVEASNIESKNGKIYINLPEKMLFTTGSSTVSAKGKQALDKLAEVLASNDNVEVDIITTAAYYADGTTGNMSTTPEKNSDDAKTTADKDAVSDKSSSPTTANIGDSAYPSSGSVTTGKTKQDPDVKASKKAKSTTIASQNNNQGDRSMTFKSTPKKTTKVKSAAPSWNLNVARSTAIVRELTQNGLPHASIVLAGQNAKGMKTNEWGSSNKGYQIVLSPKMDSYNQMMQEGQGSTSKK